MTDARRFSFRLALALGHPNPDAMLAVMPYRIWQDWLEYAQIEPFGEERADLRAGIIASTVANCLARQKGRPAFRVEDFMPKFRPRAVEQKTPEELLSKVMWLNQLFGGKVVDNRPQSEQAE
jgi:hypothetical protein